MVKKITKQFSEKELERIKICGRLLELEHRLELLKKEKEILEKLLKIK